MISIRNFNFIYLTTIILLLLINKSNSNETHEKSAPSTGRRSMFDQLLDLEQQQNHQYKDIDLDKRLIKHQKTSSKRKLDFKTANELERQRNLMRIIFSFGR